MAKISKTSLNFDNVIEGLVYRSRILRNNCQQGAEGSSDHVKFVD